MKTAEEMCSDLDVVEGVALYGYTLTELNHLISWIKHIRDTMEQEGITQLPDEE